MIEFDDRIVREICRIVESPAFNAVFDAMIQQARLEVEATKPEDKEQREMIYHRIVALKQTQATFRTHAEQADRKAETWR